MFAYCGNNPVNCSDPSGEITIWDITDFAFAAWSWADFISKPSWGRFGSALLDTACLLPVIPSVGGVKRGINLLDNGNDAMKAVKTAENALETVEETSEVLQKGWKVGDNINNLTKAGNTPSWSTVRQRYWKNEALLNPELYSPQNLEYMKKGSAPRVELNGKFYSMELHHIVPRRNGGSNAISNLIPLTPWDHAAIDPFRYFNP